MNQDITNQYFHGKLWFSKETIGTGHVLSLSSFCVLGIAVYPGGAEFLACGHYFDNIVTSKVRISDLDLLIRNCEYVNLSYADPVHKGVNRDVLVIRGPTMPRK